MTVFVGPVQESDAEALIAAHLQSVALHRGWVSPFTDQAGFDAYFEGLDGERTVGLVALTGDNAAPVGLFTLSQIFRKGFQSAYLGFHGMQGQVGRGLMTDALGAVVRYAFGDLGLHRLEANVQPTNERSLRLIERCGFRREGFSPRYLMIDGEWRDHERWAILADEAPLGT